MTPPKPAGAARPVLFVHYGEQWIRGSERCLLDLIDGLDRTRYLPRLWTNNTVLATTAGARGVEVELAADWGPSTGPSSQWRRAAALLRRWHPALIHANGAEAVGWTLAAARWHRVPVLAHLHLFYGWRARCVSGLHQAARIVAVSRTVLADLDLDGVPAGQSRLIYNGIDFARLEQGDRRELRAALGIPEGTVVFAAVGSLIHRKGVDILLRGAALARARGLRAAILLCGDGPERAALTQLAAELGVADDVHFLGEVGDVGAVIRDAADVGVACAREEAFGLTVAEMGGLGKPVIASAVGGHREVVRDGDTGVIVAPEDPAALAGAMRRLAGDPGARDRLGAAARRDLRARFSIDAYRAAFAALYDELTSAGPGAGVLGPWQVPRVYGHWLRAITARRLGRPIPDWPSAAIDLRGA